MSWHFQRMIITNYEYFKKKCYKLKTNIYEFQSNPLLYLKIKKFLMFHSIKRSFFEVCLIINFWYIYLQSKFWVKQTKECKRQIYFEITNVNQFCLLFIIVYEICFMILIFINLNVRGFHFHIFLELLTATKFALFLYHLNLIFPYLSKLSGI